MNTRPRGNDFDAMITNPKSTPPTRPAPLIARNEPGVTRCASPAAIKRAPIDSTFVRGFSLSASAPSRWIGGSDDAIAEPEYVIRLVRDPHTAVVGRAPERMLLQAGGVRRDLGDRENGTGDAKERDYE